MEELSDQRSCQRADTITQTGTALQSTEKISWREVLTMTDRKYRTRLCPENCNYRNRLVPYCGYCLYKIVKEMEEDENANRKNETEHTEQSD